MTRPAATILFGIDVGYMTDFDTTEEFEKVAAAGMTWRDILTALTTAPARQHGLATSSGSVAEGYEADLVVLGSDPRVDVRAFADITQRIRAGKIIYTR